MTTIDRPLGHIRVVELAGVETAFCGKLFADLGAEVVAVEPAGGSALRRVAPFVRDEDGAEVSAAWLSYSFGKRGETLDLDSPEGREGLDELLQDADVLIHGLTTKAALARGLGLERLQALHPALVIVAITPFGSDGPYSEWRGSDVVHLAMGGYLHMTGPEDGRPIKPSAPMQSYLHAGNHAFAAALLALRRRARTGEGAFIDQPIRDTATWMLTHTYQHWDMLGINLKRQGSGRDMGSKRRLKSVYPSGEGHVVWMFTTGHIGARPNRALVAWMAREGMAPPWLQELDWDGTDLLGSAEDMVEQMEAAFGAFFASHTGEELLAFAIDNGLMLAPANSVAEVAVDPQLAERDAWRTIDQPGFGRIRVPGPPVRIAGARWEPRGPAPMGFAPVAKRSAASPHPPAPSPDPAGEGESGLPLTGIRVLDFGSTLAAPVVGRHLSDFGADLIKVESQTHPDTLRVGTPYAGGVAGIDRSGYFAAYNAGKQSFALNLQAPGARDVVRQLVERSDVLLENFAPGVMTRLGLDYETLRSWNPRLILASHSLQGQTGPRSRHRGYGQIASGMTGWYDLTGEAGGEPLGPYSAYTDFLSWPFLLSAILIALDVRERTGEGTRIDHAQVESSLHFLAPLLLEYERSGQARTRQGNAEDDAVPSNTYPCRDGEWIAISVDSDERWRRLCELLGMGDEADDQGLATLVGRAGQRARIDAAIDRRTRDREAHQLVEELQEAGISAGLVARASDLFADPQFTHRGFFRRLPHEELGGHAVITHSFRVSGMAAGPFTGAPRLGEDTYAIARELLVMDDETFAELTASGVLN